MENPNLKWMRTGGTSMTLRKRPSDLLNGNISISSTVAV